MSSLPHDPANLDIIIVCKEGASSTYKDFHVRKSRILEALQWLKANNRYINNISIKSATLSQLPEDGHLSSLSVLTTETEDHIIDSCGGSSFVPSTYQKQETIQKSIDHQSPVMWPALGSTPVDEFHSEGYLSQAFPTLYPTGAADFTSPRLRTVTIGNYFKH